LPAAAAPPPPTGINNDALQLDFDLQSGTVRSWRVLGAPDGRGGDRDLAAPAGRLFALQGSLGGVAMQEWERRLGGWKVLESGPRSVTLRLAHPQGAFEVDKRWTLGDSTWRATFAVSIRTGGMARSDTDVLKLEVGAGIGEVPSQGLGMAQGMYSYTEAVHRDPEGVHRLRLDAETPDAAGTGSEWLGLQSRYFALVLAPANDASRQLRWRASLPPSPKWQPRHPAFETLLELDLPLPAQGAHEPATFRWDVFGGGKSHSALTMSEPDLGGLLFSGLWTWMRALTVGIMHTLNAIHGIVGNWGVSIILLAVLVRVLMHPVARNAMAAQKRFVALHERIRPELDEIKRNYRGGEQSERILQLYERHNTSPFAGLKPLLIVMLQIPVFVALFHLLGQSFEISSVPFLWMDTLADPDKLFHLGVDLPFFGAYFNLLPALMAVSSLASIKLAPAPTQGANGKSGHTIMLAAMGIAFFLLFYSFPSGMVLYWVAANILQVIHQAVIASRE